MFERARFANCSSSKWPFAIYTLLFIPLELIREKTSSIGYQLYNRETTNDYKNKHFIISAIVAWIGDEQVGEK